MTLISAEIFPLSKKCSHCGEEKPLSQFSKSKRNKFGRNHRCSKCMWSYQKAWKAKNPHQGKKILEAQRKRYAAKLDISNSFRADTPHKCGACGKLKTVADFSKDKTGKQHGRADKCKVCCSKSAKFWREKMPLEIRQAKSRKAKYGLTTSHFEHLWVAQAGSCAICRSELHKTSKYTVIDHCHSTNVIRGILCKKCNTTLGWARDDIGWLEAAIRYLSAYRTEGV